MLPVDIDRFDQQAVPQVMEVAAGPLPLQLHRIAAAILGTSGVQRLMQITDEVDQILQRIAALGLRCPQVADQRCRCLDRCDDTAAIGAVARRLIPAAAAREVDVVQRAAVGRSGFVGPVGDAGQRRLRLADQQCRDGLLRGRCQLGRGKFANEAVAFGPPGQRRGSGRHQRGGGQQPGGSARKPQRHQTRDTLTITTGSTGTSWPNGRMRPVGVVPILSSTSWPADSLPNTA